MQKPFAVFRPGFDSFWGVTVSWLRRAKGRLPGQVDQSLCQPWAVGFVLVVEEDERLEPNLVVDPLHTRLQRRIVVVEQPQVPIVSIRRCHEGDFKFVVGISNARSGAMKMAVSESSDWRIP